LGKKLQAGDRDMPALFAYVKASEGPFNPLHYGGTTKNPNIHDEVYVISGDSPLNHNIFSRIIRDHPY
jgi:hypothetical protein